MSGYITDASIDYALKYVSPNITTIYPNGTIEIVTNYSYYSGLIPGLGYNAALIVIWSILLGIQVPSFYYKQYWFSGSLICASILELLGYIGRTWSHFNLYARNAYLLQMVALTIAPVFTMAGMYFQLAKLIEIYSHKFAFLSSPLAYSQIFIFCDIVSLIIQAAGGGVAGGAVKNNKPLGPGEHIFIAGLAIQVATMSIFIFLWLDFVYKVYVKTRMEHLNITSPFAINKLKSVFQEDIDYLYREKYYNIRHSENRYNRFALKYFPWAFTASICCIYTRCCYRLAELVNGFNGYIITHEIYFIVLDGVMILLATTIMMVFFPGFAFNGREVTIEITKGRVDPETLLSTDEEENSTDASDASKEEEHNLNGEEILGSLETETTANNFKKFFKNPLKK